MMNINPLNWFKRNEIDIEFKDIVGSACVDFPIRTAKREPLSFIKQQKDHNGKLKFHNCPGMIDYAQMGYILPAWETIKIKANKAGSVAFYYHRVFGRSRSSNPVKMSSDVVHGIFEPEDGVQLQPWKCDSPWKIYCKKDISAFLMPAIYHSNFLDDLYVYPGVVDYKNFKTVNFIFAAKRECEVTIKAGEPLLQVIPFYNKHITAGYALANIEEAKSASKSVLFDAIPHQYKKHSTKKQYDLNSGECPFKKKDE